MNSIRIEVSNDIDEEQGMAEPRDWAREAEEYLLYLKPASRDDWLDRLREILGQWSRFETYMRDWPKDMHVFPRMLEMASSFSDRRVITDRTFDSVGGFVDCLKTSVG